MSTRSTTHFHFEGESKPEAIVYRHTDGYPESMLSDLDEFFQDVIAQTGGDTRFNDPTYLAAKWVVWLANKFSKYSSGNLLDFLSVGIMMEDPFDIEYRYHVYCDASGDFLNPVTPTVIWDEV